MLGEISYFSVFLGKGLGNWDVVVIITMLPIMWKDLYFQGLHLTWFINTMFNLEVKKVILGSILISKVETLKASMPATDQEQEL